MGNAPALPDQTPVSFLRGGAADMFSAQCKALLAQAGYDPGTFGSYDHTAKQIREAREQCRKYDVAVAAGQAPPVAQPTPQQRYLGGSPPDYRDGCQSGHLTQNAVYQDERGNPCSNVAPGHADNLFPCMPQRGHAMQPGGEHQLATIDEQNSAAGPDGTRRAGDRYPAGQIEEDSDDRTRRVANDQQLAQRNLRQPTAAAGAAEGASAGGGAQSGGTAAAAAGADAQAASKPNEPWNQELTGDSAGDCINAFRKAGEAAMRQKCKDDRAKNRARANGGKDKTETEGVAYRQKLAREAADARTAADKDPDDAGKQKKASRAEARSTAAERAKCRADQGDYLENGTQRPPPAPPYPPGPPFDGVVPRNVEPAQTQTGQTDANQTF
jgi:hypothetical protein